MVGLLDTLVTLSEGILCLPNIYYSYGLLLLQLRAAFAAVMLFSVDSVKKKGMMPLVVTSAGIE